MVQTLQIPTKPRSASSKNVSTKSAPMAGAEAFFPSDVLDCAPVSLSDAIARFRKYARNVTLSCGETSPEAAVAWEQLDELLSVRAHEQDKCPQSSLDQYCALHPDAVECRLYDA